MAEPEQTAPPLDEAIAAAHRAFAGALREGDARAAAAVYTLDAKMLAPSAEPLAGRDAIEAFWRAGVGAGVFDVDLQALELEQRDNVAYEFGRYSFRLQPGDGTTVVDRGKYLLLHARQPDGTWRREVEMFSPDPVRSEGVER